MTKPKLNTARPTRSASRKTIKSKSRTGVSAFIFQRRQRGPATKHARIIAMLRAPCRRNSCSPHDRHGLAAAFGARLPFCSKSFAKSSVSILCFRTERQRPGISRRRKRAYSAAG